MKITSQYFGCTRDGQIVKKFRLTDGPYTVCVLTLGGIIQSIIVPDRKGNLTDVVLGFDRVSHYEMQSAYMGAVVGRCANRIAGKPILIGEKEVNLLCNDNGICHLHGGKSGFDSKIWIPDVSEDALTLEYTSENGEEGYPGNLHVSVMYQLKDGALSLTYRAMSDMDTICSLTNHSYFNLSGHSSGEIGAQQIEVFASRYTPIGKHSIPTGEIRNVDQTPLDLRRKQSFASGWDNGFDQIAAARGYDHNFLIDGSGMRPFVQAESMRTGIVLSVESDMPGMQLYSGNYLSAELPAGKNGARYGRRHGFCMETQYPPDAVHHPHFAQPILRAGELYEQKTIFQFSVMK